jgi:hypothetical protein
MLMVSGVVGGVDTRADVHVAAALDANGGLLGIESFPVNEAGYCRLAEWLAGFGPVIRVGIEGTGSYGVGLTRFLHTEGVEVVEVDRPNRHQKRRRLGKSDPIDAEAEASESASGTLAFAGVVVAVGIGFRPIGSEVGALDAVRTAYPGRVGVRRCARGQPLESELVQVSVYQTATARCPHPNVG